jgi:hypothetical protein
MTNLSIADKMVLMGSVGIGTYFLILYALAIPFSIPTVGEGFVGHLWIAWIVISCLSLGIGILVKIINSKKTS